MCGRSSRCLGGERAAWPGNRVDSGLRARMGVCRTTGVYCGWGRASEAEVRDRVGAGNHPSLKGWRRQTWLCKQRNVNVLGFTVSAPAMLKHLWPYRRVCSDRCSRLGRDPADGRPLTLPFESKSLRKLIECTQRQVCLRDQSSVCRWRWCIQIAQLSPLSVSGTRHQHPHLNSASSGQ